MTSWMSLLVERYKGTNLSDKPDSYILRYLEAAHSSAWRLRTTRLHVRHPARHYIKFKNTLEICRREQYRHYVTHNNSVNFGVYRLAYLSRVRYLPGSDFGAFSL